MHGVYGSCFIGMVTYLFYIQNTQQTFFLPGIMPLIKNKGNRRKLVEIGGPESLYEQGIRRNCYFSRVREKYRLI